MCAVHGVRAPPRSTPVDLSMAYCARPTRRPAPRHDGALSDADDLILSRSGASSLKRAMGKLFDPSVDA
jgi:hypothetical protein